MQQRIDGSKSYQTWSPNMVTKHGHQTWSPNMVTKQTAFLVEKCALV